MPGRARTAQPTAETTVYVSVERQDDSPVQGLTGRDFQVLVDGKPTPLLRATAGPQPLRLVLLVGVTTQPAIAKRDIEQGIDRFVASLLPGDRARIGRVGGAIALGPETADSRALRRAAKAVIEPRAADRSGPSPIWDAVVEAVTALGGVEGRRAIILITDGRATGNRHGLEEAASVAVAANVAVSVIAPKSTYQVRSESVLVRVHPERLPQALAAFSGGLFLTFDPFQTFERNGISVTVPFSRLKEGTVDLPLPRIVSSLRNEYALTIPRPVGDEPRLLEVRANLGGVTMRARRAVVAAEGR
jgi:hypothetical protein